MKNKDEKRAKGLLAVFIGYDFGFYRSTAQTLSRAVEKNTFDC